jgi:hypothetical protein
MNDFEAAIFDAAIIIRSFHIATRITHMVPLPMPAYLLVPPEANE